MDNIIERISIALKNDSISDEIKDITDPLMIVGLDGRIIEVSNELLNLLEFEKEELLNKWYPKAIGIYDNENNKLHSIEFPITKAVLTGKRVQANLIYSKSDGSKIKVLVGAHPITLDQRPLGIVEFIVRAV